MTQRIYYTDAFRRRFDAHVVERADGGRRIYLDATAFYPTSGGQPHDTGMLGGVPVVDVIDEGERIAHLLAEPLALDEPGGRATHESVTGASRALGQVVTAEIDWARRLDHMQQHTGQHLLSAVLEDLFGWPTVSVHFGAEESTLDVEAGIEEVRTRLAAAERRVNELVAENRPVTVTFEDAATVAGLRKPSGRTGEIRVVTIDGVDRSACGGTHVSATGAIGAVLVTGAERVRAQTRVSFRCGGRVVARARRDGDALAQIAGALSGSVAEASQLAARMAADLRALQAEQRRLAGELVAYRVRELLAGAPADASGIRRVVDVRPGATADELRSLAQAMSREPRVVYVGASPEPPFVVLAASEDVGIDAGRTLREALAAESGRGGGSPRAAQGTVPDAGAVERVLARLAAIVPC